MNEIIKCFRFVNNDLTSGHGGLTWEIGEWNHVDGKIACCGNGLHAALTPRDSLENVYGQRWFIAEAKGETDHQSRKFAASDMRLVREIPENALRHFAVWCAADCLKYYENSCPDDTTVHRCLLAAENCLNGELTPDALAPMAASMTSLSAPGGAGRALAAAIAALYSVITPECAAWANAAAAAGYAAHLGSAASEAAATLIDANARITNVSSAAQAAVLADSAAATSKKAAAAAAKAHAAAVCAAHRISPADTAGDMYYSAFEAYTMHEPDPYCYRQNDKLTELVDQQNLSA